MAIVSVSDQGQGINPQIMPRLFQKFISGSEKGTCLGLYISKNIVMAHGGEIWVENKKSGIGATFVFTLPLLKWSTCEGFELIFLIDSSYELEGDDISFKVHRIQKKIHAVPEDSQKKPSWLRLKIPTRVYNFYLEGQIL